jgi:hypothetical protein
MQYTIPKTGDLDGDIPSQYYATTDPEAFNQFLSRCDILVCSLPSTPQTTYMLDASHLSEYSVNLAWSRTQLMSGRLPEGAIFLNVGRGDLIRSGRSRHTGQADGVEVILEVWLST